MSACACDLDYMREIESVCLKIGMPDLIGSFAQRNTDVFFAMLYIAAVWNDLDVGRLPILVRHDESFEVPRNQKTFASCRGIADKFLFRDETKDWREADRLLLDELKGRKHDE